ncbi:hypothetical protein D9611_014356 [Ephemerocybe angulata]|uniref:Uncharacterized protein n=1 Tax=Ephemerocybe angulata TaxID=980116 RepID=A0A8H5B7X6_9AGAR|nr:hypothetical protein D9611_014356 [Tulosesus angulatus]
MSGQGSTQSYGDGTGAVPVDVIVRALEKLGPITKEALACAAVELNLAHPDACPGHNAAPAEEEEDEVPGNFDYASNSSGSPPSSPVPYVVDSDSSDGSTPSSPIHIVYFEAQERHLRDSAYSDEDSAPFPIAVPPQIIDSAEGRLVAPVLSLRSSILFQPLGPPKRSYTDVLSRSEDSGEANDDEDHDDTYDNRGKKQRISLRAASPASSELFNIDSFMTRYRDSLLSDARMLANSGATPGQADVNEDDGSHDDNADGADARSAYASAREYDSGDEAEEEVEGGRASPDFTLKTPVKWDEVASGDESEEEFEESHNPFTLETFVNWEAVLEAASNALAEYNDDEEAADETEEAAPEVARVPQNPRFTIRNLLN